jgi:hypothetical protein
MNAAKELHERECRYARLHHQMRVRDLSRRRPLDSTDLRLSEDSRQILTGEKLLTRCVDLNDRAYLAELDAFEAEQDARAKKGYYEPDWETYTLIAQVADMAEAMDRYYKSDRLNRPGGTRERLIAHNQAEYNTRGFACIASYHDSMTGRSIFVRPAEPGLAIWSSDFA